MAEDLIIHTDGGSRGNPGSSACAFVAEKDGKELHKESKFLGIQTNNFAEYSAILLALRWISSSSIIANNYSLITFCSDSELVVKQLNGLYKIKNQNLKKLNEEIKKIILENSLRIVFRNVPREGNIIADALVNEELDKIE
jgi:ribonuclease HI